MFYAQASHVDLFTARIVATNYMEYRNPSRSYIPVDVLAVQKDYHVLYYQVTFEHSGWILLSADYRDTPVIGYSENGNWNQQSEMSAFMLNDDFEFTESDALISGKSNPLWDQIIHKQFNPGVSTLRFTYPLSTGLVQSHWGQSINNSGTCTPAFNAFAPDASQNEVGCFGLNTDGCNCSRKPVGCGAVAMAQVMRFWEFPNKSTVRPYDWDLMPHTMLSSTAQNQSEAIARLLRDCGDKAGTTYCCQGSYTTTNSLVDALINAFKFQGAEKKSRSNWGNAGWEALIRAEIDAGRPVIYRGDEADLDSDKHIFIVDGYRTGPLEFHVNWGWRGGSDGFFSLGSLLTYDENNQAVVGISPKCNLFQQDITDLPYNSITSGNFLHEQSRNTISLPATGETFSIENGGKFIVTTGNVIRLKPGFTIHAGAEFKANMKTMGYGEIGATASLLYPNPINAGEILKVDVTNADSWECQVYTSAGALIYSNAGSVTSNGMLTIWQPQNIAAAAYVVDVRIRNSCGELVKVSSTITYLGGNGRMRVEENIIGEDQGDEISGEHQFVFFPNPGKGLVNIKLLKANTADYEILDAMGNIIDTGVLTKRMNTLDLSENAQGLYFIKINSGVVMESQRFTID
jgi:hypothetical protein